MLQQFFGYFFPGVNTFKMVGVYVVRGGKDYRPALKVFQIMTSIIN